MDPTQLQLRDRFQGAIIGIFLTPTAVVQASTIPRLVAYRMSQEIARSVAAALEQWPIAAGGASWLFGLPLLLRYHDQSPSLRHDHIKIELMKAGMSVDTVNMAQICGLSDILTGALRYSDDGSVAAIDYSSVTNSSRSDALSFSQRAFTVGVSNAIAQPLTYVQAVSQAAAQATGVASPVDARLAWQAPLVASFLSGALLGRRALPVLWQRDTRWGADELKLKEALRIADTIFEQWMGCLS